MRSIVVAGFVSVWILPIVTLTALAQSAKPCDGADSADCLRQLVDERLATEAAYLRGQGFSSSHRTRFARIVRGRSEPFRIDLTEGVEYALVAACAAECDHVRLVLSNATGPFAESPEKQAVVILNGAVPETGDYTVALSAPGCQRDNCGVGFVIVRKAAVTAPAASAPVPAAKSDPVPVPPAVAFNTYDNYDMLGGDLRKIQKVEQEACATECRSDNRCVAYSYDKWNKWCFTKDATSDLIFTARSLTALREGGGAPTFSTGDQYFERFRNKGFPKQSQSKQVTDSFEKCEALCGETDWCSAFTYFKSVSECQRYRSTGEYFSNGDADSGAKRQKASTE
jgi:PAN domain